MQVLVELEFEGVAFCGERKTEVPKEKPLEEGNKQQQTQPTYHSREESALGNIGGSQTLSPMCHLCSIKAYPMVILIRSVLFSTEGNISTI